MNKRDELMPYLVFTAIFLLFLIQCYVVLGMRDSFNGMENHLRGILP